MGSSQKLAPTPEFDGEGLVRRLISELEALDEPVVLVIDDLHELVSPDAQAQLELLLARRPRLLYVVLATRHDPSLGLHRLRLAGELTELRAVDLRLSAEEARQLLDASGVELSAEAAAMLLARTEGWAAGLRLATMSLAGHPDPERFVAEFAGSERTVADYLLAEVLERQPEEVRQLLLRTSILERVCGPLADRLTGASGSERMLLELEDSNAFVVSVDPERSWFRYHPLFADLLLLELRRSEPDAIGDLHRVAADWLAEHGHAVDAIRHAQAAGDWKHAGRLLADHGLSLSLDGQVATIGALLAAFPADALSHPELAALLAYVELTQHSLETAAAYIALAERHASEVVAERQHQFAVMLAVVRLELARRRGDLESALREVGPLLEPVEADSVTELTLSNDARAVALMNLGIVELWSFRLDDAERHLEQGLALARLIDRPYVQIGCLSHLGLGAARRSLAQARQRCLRGDRDRRGARLGDRPDRLHRIGDDGLGRRGAGPVRGGTPLARPSRALDPGGARPRHGPARALRARRAACRRGPVRGGTRRVPGRRAAPGRAGHLARADRPGQGVDRADAAADGRRDRRTGHGRQPDRPGPRVR